MKDKVENYGGIFWMLLRSWWRGWGRLGPKGIIVMEGWLRGFRWGFWDMIMIAISLGIVGFKRIRIRWWSGLKVVKGIKNKLRSLGRGSRKLFRKKRINLLKSLLRLKIGGVNRLILHNFLILLWKNWGIKLIHYRKQ